VPLIVLGVVFGLGQAVPIWLGLTLLSESSTTSVIFRTPDDGPTADER